MSFNSLLIHTVTVTNPKSTGTIDIFGDRVPDTESFTERVRIDVNKSSEEIIDRDTRTTDFFIFALPDTHITGLSTVTWGTRTLRVVGEPRPRYGKHTLHHWEFDAEEILGG